MNPKKHAWMNALAILFFVVSIAIFVFSLTNYYSNLDQEVLYTDTSLAPQIPDHEKISIMSKPSGVPVKNPGMTDAEKIKIMTGKK
jgi:hypothetical protein